MRESLCSLQNHVPIHELVRNHLMNLENKQIKLKKKRSKKIKAKKKTQKVRHSCYKTISKKQATPDSQQHTHTKIQVIQFLLDFKSCFCCLPGI